MIGEEPGGGAGAASVGFAAGTPAGGMLSEVTIGAAVGFTRNWVLSWSWMAAELAAVPMSLSATKSPPAGATGFEVMLISIHDV